MRRLVFVLPLLVSVNALADASIPKAQWIVQMQKLLPTTFCQPGMYFRECFKVTEAQCNEVASTTTHQCLKDVEDKLPATLDASSGRDWGTKVGTCAGGQFETSQMTKKVASAKCSDPSNWVPK
jgi:hypothetical protein